MKIPTQYLMGAKLVDDADVNANFCDLVVFLVDSVPLCTKDCKIHPQVMAV